MTKKHEVTRADIMDMTAYAESRNERRAAITELKRNRRISVGPFATFYFENYETMWMQIHEMLYIERGGEEQIPGELEAYNPLIPKGRDLIATLMLEIDEPERRDRELSRLGGIDEAVRLQVGNERVTAEPVDEDMERTTPDGKTSSVHFLRFSLTDAQVAAFRDPSVQIALGFDHAAYGHIAIVSAAVRDALATDFD